MNGLQVEVDADINGIFLGEDSEQTPGINDVGLVTQADLPASNGMIHRINRVLFPPEVAEPMSCASPRVINDFGAFIGTTEGGDSAVWYLQCPILFS